jgi:nuclear pore complex protein Nup133
MFILLQHDSVGPHGGFSFFVFKELVNSRQYSKLLRLGEEFQEELAGFLKDRNDLLWLHEICLNQFSSASETLHTYALRGGPDEDASVTTSTKALSFAERRRLLYLSKIAATAGTPRGYIHVILCTDTIIQDLFIFPAYISGITENVLLFSPG